MAWSRFWRRKRWDEERAREIETYLEAETADNAARGMPLEQARRAARKRLGNPTRLREEIYRMNSIGWLETIWHDFAFSLRMLRKSPGFTLVGLLSLSLGIGATTAIFSIVNATLLRPLPYPDSARLVQVVRPDGGDSVTMSELQFAKEHVSSFAASAGFRGPSDRGILRNEGVDWIKVMPVTADFFRTLGISPARGREFDADESRSGGPNAMVLTDALWQRSFHADPSVVGQSFRLENGDASTVVGVLPPAFWLPQEADAFLPLRASGGLDDRGMNTSLVARLKPARTLQQADTELRSFTGQLRLVASGGPPQYRGLRLASFQESIVGDRRSKLLLLFGAVFFLLLITCSNLAGLVLARLTVQHRQIALRMALGSSRVRILRQYFLENLTLALAGGLAGAYVAPVLLAAFLAQVPFDLPASAPIRIDSTALAFALALAFATAILFSLPSLWTASRLRLHDALKSGGRTGIPKLRSRNALVIGQVALATTLLVSAALLIENLYRLHQERLGFDAQNMLTFWTPTEPSRSGNKSATQKFADDVLRALNAVPGVRGAAGISTLPLAGKNNFPAERIGDPDHSIGGMEVRYITPGYFQVMRIPVTRGRGFTDNDTTLAPPAILINQTVSRLWWPKGDPLGAMVKLGRYHGEDLPQIKDPPREVVGVVSNIKTVSLQEAGRPTVYVPVNQVPYDQGLNWVLRFDGSQTTEAMEARLRRAVAGIDSRQRVLKMRPMEKIVSAGTADSRFNAWVFGSFAALALLLTAVGIYGLLSYSVSRRTSEFGTRMALGATSGGVLRMVMRQGMALVAVGFILGLASSLALSRGLAAGLFGVHAPSLSIFAEAAGVLLISGFTASYLPARRATRIDPISALRYE